MQQPVVDKNTHLLTWSVRQRVNVLDSMYVVYGDGSDDWFNGPTWYTLYSGTTSEGVLYHDILVEDSETEPMDVMACFKLPTELIDAHWYLMKTEFLLTGTVSRELALSNTLLQGTSGG